MRYTRTKYPVLRLAPVWKIASRPRGEKFWTIADPDYGKRVDALFVAQEISREADVYVFKQGLMYSHPDSTACFFRDQRP